MITLLLAAKILSFQGGESRTLAKLLAAQTSLPVAVLVHSPKPLKAFEIKWEDEKDLKRLFPVVAKLDLAGQAGYGVTKKGWPQFEAPYWGQKSYMLPLTAEGIPDRSFKELKVTFASSGGKYLQVADLSNANLSKPITIHWWFERLAVTVCAKDASEESFLSAIATAIGADFINSKKGYRFDFDPAIYRRRALESLSQPRLPRTYEKYSFAQNYQNAVDNLLRLTITIVTDSQLKTVFQKQNGTIFIKASDPRLRAAIDKKVEMIVNLSKSDIPALKQIAQAYSSQLEQVDWDRPAEVVFGPPGSTGVFLPFKGTTGGGVF